MNASKRRATVYLRRRQFYVHSVSQTTQGVWIFTSPCTKLDLKCPDTRLGEAIMSALSGSRDGVPHPVKWGHLIDPLLQQAGVKSWATFAAGASCVEIEDDGSRISIIPSKNLGARNGFLAEPTNAVTIATHAPEEVGAHARAKVNDEKEEE